MIHIIYKGERFAVIRESDGFFLDLTHPTILHPDDSYIVSDDLMVGVVPLEINYPIMVVGKNYIPDKDPKIEGRVDKKPLAADQQLDIEGLIFTGVSANATVINKE